MFDIEELFFANRFPSGWKLIPLILYLPIGLALATIRFFIGIQAIMAASVLHKLSSFRGIVLRTMCAILGIFVIEENGNVRDKSVKIIVTNHVSIFDHLVIHLISESISTSNCNLPSILHFAFNCKNLGSLKDKEAFLHNVKSSIDKGFTLDVQPENAITSGETGLLRFSAWPCELSEPIQPVSIKMWRPPLMEIKPSAISATWYSDTFWFLFVPFTVFTIKYLPVINQLENETAEDMSKRVESAVASDLQISRTNFTSSDKAEFEKRRDAEQSIIKLSGGKPDLKTMEMAWKVKEVLPDIPIKTICIELAKTKNFDVTMTNFLEGLVRYVPEQTPNDNGSANRSAIPENKRNSLETSQPSTSFDVSAKTFAKSARDRMLSFQQRKMRLIENARQRYIEKHAINIINIS